MRLVQCDQEGSWRLCRVPRPVLLPFLDAQVNLIDVWRTWWQAALVWVEKATLFISCSELEVVSVTSESLLQKVAFPSVVFLHPTRCFSPYSLLPLDSQNSLSTLFIFHWCFLMLFCFWSLQFDFEHSECPFFLLLWKQIFIFSPYLSPFPLLYILFSRVEELLPWVLTSWESITCKRGHCALKVNTICSTLVLLAPMWYA